MKNWPSSPLRKVFGNWFDCLTIFQNNPISQLDGALDSSDEDDDDDDDDDDDIDDDDENDKDEDENDENEGGAEEVIPTRLKQWYIAVLDMSLKRLWFQEPLNSGDDVSDDDPSELFETDNVVVCQYDKVNPASVCSKICFVIS